MMKLRFYLIGIILFFAAGACDFNDIRLSVKNNSNHAIVFETSLDTNMQYSNNIQYYIENKILPGETGTKTQPGSTNAWSLLIRRSNNKKLNIFIVNVDTLIKYNDFGYINTRKLYKRYEFTETDLDKINWIIEYP